MKQLGTKLKVKIGAAVVLLGLIGVVIYQNITNTPVKFFKWEFSMPLIVLIINAILIGFLLGFMSCKFYISKKKT